MFGNRGDDLVGVRLIHSNDDIGKDLSGHLEKPELRQHRITNLTTTWPGLANFVYFLLLSQFKKKKNIKFMSKHQKWS